MCKNKLERFPIAQYILAKLKVYVYSGVTVSYITQVGSSINPSNYARQKSCVKHSSLFCFGDEKSFMTMTSTPLNENFRPQPALMKFLKPLDLNIKHPGSHFSRVQNLTRLVCQHTQLVTWMKGVEEERKVEWHGGSRAEWQKG